jgi:hypothetical protein
MEILNPTTWIFFFEGIIGATPLNPILIPHSEALVIYHLSGSF